MPPPTPNLIVIYVSLVIAIIMFPLTWVARNVWRDRSRTRLFALIGIISMMVFMVTAWDYLP